MATAGTSALDEFITRFTTQIDSGFGVISGDVQTILGTLVVISIVLTAIMWAIDETQNVLGPLVRKILLVGFFAWLVGNWHSLSVTVVTGFGQLGLRAGGGASIGDFMSAPTRSVEAGFKIMRRYHYSRGEAQRVRIIALSQSFHGRTLAPLAASANPLHVEGFLTGDPGFDQVPWGDIAALRAAITETTAGVILEPIQGEGGIRVTPFDYLRQVRELCDEKGILLMFDEVQSGVGRSGHLYAYQASGVVPDLLASAKGLGGGFPIGACLASERVAAPMVAGTHGSTFGGNPLATAVGNAVLDVIMAPGFLDQMMARSAQLCTGLAAIIADNPHIVSQQTGMGLMLGVKCVINNADFAAALKDARLLVVKAGGNSLRLLPPLNVTAAEVDEALAIIRATCAKWPAAEG
mgnify:CR=1 FL=1